MDQIYQFFQLISKINLFYLMGWRQYSDIFFWSLKNYENNSNSVPEFRIKNLQLNFIKAVYNYLMSFVLQKD